MTTGQHGTPLLALEPLFSQSFKSELSNKRRERLDELWALDELNLCPHLVRALLLSFKGFEPGPRLVLPLVEIETRVKPGS